MARNALLRLAGLGLLAWPAAMASAADFSNNGIAVHSNGSAGGNNSTLTLTNGFGQTGSVFTHNAIAFNPGTSFDTSFSFNLGTLGGGTLADGFGFVVQNSASGNTAIGAGGSSVGYFGPNPIRNSLGVAFQSFTNNKLQIATTNGNGQVSVPTAVNYNLNSVGGPPQSASGTVRVHYDAGAGLLTLMTTGTGGPVTLQQQVNLSSFVGQQAYFGFTGATGASASTQTINNWNLQVVDVAAGNAGKVLVNTQGGAPIAIQPRGGNVNTFVSGATPSFGGTFSNFGSSYAFRPAQRGNATGTGQVFLNNSPLGYTVNFAGQGVAPVNQVSKTDAGFTRIGTSSTAQVKVSNIGDGNQAGNIAPNQQSLTNLNGQAFGANGGGFSGSGGSLSLQDGTSKSFDYSFTPTTHGAASATVGYQFNNGSSDGRNFSQGGNVQIAGTGVGPAFAGSADTLDFGEVAIGALAELGFDVWNDILNEFDLGDELVGLSLLDFDLAGAGAEHFALLGLDDPVVLSPGELLHLFARFMPGALGGYDVTLTLHTDLGAAFGGDGQDFSIRLIGSAVAAVPGAPAQVPEPGTFALALTIAAGWWLRRRKP